MTGFIAILNRLRMIAHTWTSGDGLVIISETLRVVERYCKREIAADGSAAAGNGGE